jgi:hypothetical protein
MAFVEKQGYVRINESREHVLIAEKALGHKLPKGTEVHHFDLNGSNNDCTNLVICEDKSYHKLLHVRQRIATAGGDPNCDSWCTRCGEIKPRSCFGPLARTQNGLAPTCRDCHNKKQRERIAAFGRNDRPNSHIRRAMKARSK